MVYTKGGETLVWVAQRGSRNLIPGTIAAQNPVQPGLAADTPAYCRRLD